MRDKDYYRVLQVDPAADPEVVTAAFRALARKLHPDTDASGIDAARMAELNRAYGVLREPARRKAYDAERSGQALAVGPGSPSARPAPSTSGNRWESRAATPDAPGHMKIDFGRYTGYTLQELARIDPDYLRWLSRHSSGIRYRNAIARVLAERASDPYGARSAR